MILIIGTFTLLHVLFYFSLTYEWRKIDKPTAKKPSTAFSIIVPVRNEAANIVRLLDCLEKQDYPKDLYEVVIVNDFSEDETLEVIDQFTSRTKVTVKLITLKDVTKQGKKHALTAGVKASTHETVLTTDADCWMSSNWLMAYNKVFSQDVNMVAGPVSIEGKGIFGRLQQVEFAGLIGFGAVTIHKENPSMCSGANLGFKKRAFDEVGGYKSNLFTPSGDDEFLLYDIMKRFPHSTRFLKDPAAVVRTSAHTRFSSFINQRTRWTSKWKHNKNWKVRLSAVLFFFDYLFFYAALILGILGSLNLYFVILVFLLRYLSDFAFVASVNRFLKGKRSFLILIFFQIIYPMHVLFMGLNSIFGSYTWKGRNY